MTFLLSIFVTFMLLLALLVIASATDYGYGPAPKIENPQTDYTLHPTKLDYEVPKPKTDYKSQPTIPVYEVPKPKTYYKSYPTKPDYEVPKPKTDYKSQPTKPDYEVPKPKIDSKTQPIKPDYEVPKPKADYKSQPTKPNYELPKPKTNYNSYPTKPEYKLLPTIIAVQGVVLCKSGSNYFPIQGAVARVTCGCVDEHGYKAAPISVLSHITDNKGYFFAKLSLADFGSKLKLTECKTYLESSPLETCKVPTDVNYGISGARLSSYRLIHNNIKLYSVPPFFCTSSLPKPAPQGY